MASILVTFLLLFALTTLLISLGLRFMETQKKKKVTQMLVTSDGQAALREAKVLLEPTIPSGVSLYLARFNFAQQAEAQIQQAGLNWTVSGLLAQMLILGVLGALLGLWANILMLPWLSVLAMAGFLGSLPYLYVLRQLHNRLSAFEQQFPEGLDFLARAMRAGHAFAISLEMLADEGPQPLSVEFRKVFNEQNLGLPIETALKNLVTRVPLLDVRFFVSAVLLQRETGGNLSEILTKLAHIIRERFQLRGQVRAASAHGRLTGTILTIMPVVLMLGLMVVAPGYLQSMAADPDGKYIIAGAIVCLLLGHISIRRIIDIKV